jgi:hypothetical protein
MKKIFAIYTLIGIFCVPFIYSNNAEGYRSGSSSLQWGHSIGGAFYWPSYIFSIEPEVNSDSLDSFQESLLEILKYRNDKLFTGQRSSEHGYLVLTSIGNCLAVEGAGKENIPSLYEKIFTDNKDNRSLNGIKQKIMEKFDGYDFADIVSEGGDCKEELEELLASGELKPIDIISNIIQAKDNDIKIDKINLSKNNQDEKEVVVPNIESNCDLDAQDVLKKFGLIGKRIDVHGPEDEDASSIGCPYRQSPKAGTIVKKGTTVTYRAWWEAS